MKRFLSIFALLVFVFAASGTHNAQAWSEFAPLPSNATAKVKSPVSAEIRSDKVQLQCCKPFESEENKKASKCVSPHILVESPCIQLFSWLAESIPTLTDKHFEGIRAPPVKRPPRTIL